MIMIFQQFDFDSVQTALVFLAQPISYMAFSIIVGPLVDKVVCMCGAVSIYFSYMPYHTNRVITDTSAYLDWAWQLHHSSSWGPSFTLE
jgi:hypothetical protein